MKIGKFILYKKLGCVIFDKINSKIQTLRLGRSSNDIRFRIHG
jgi:hypothetical protein